MTKVGVSEPASRLPAAEIGDVPEAVKDFDAVAVSEAADAEK